jgi:hypothetical protein
VPLQALLHCQMWFCDLSDSSPLRLVDDTLLPARPPQQHQYRYRCKWNRDAESGLLPIWHVAHQHERRWRRLGTKVYHAPCVGLADSLLIVLGAPPRGSAIVTLDLPGAAERLAAAGITATSRAGRTRPSFHVYNTAEDVEMAVAALRGK